MENEHVKASVLKRAFSSLSLFVRTLPQNDVNNEIEDIDDLGKFSEEDKATIEEIRKVEAQLKKAAANSAASKKGLQKTILGKEIAHEGRPTIMKTVVEKDERIRG